VDGRAQTTFTLGAAGTQAVRAASAGFPNLTFSATGVAADSAGIEVAGGQGQSGTVGTALATALGVTVKDSGGMAVSGVTVTFAVTEGGGGLSALEVVTGASGLAESSLTLGTVAGVNTVTASGGGLAGTPVRFTATAVAGDAGAMELVSGDGQSGFPSTTLTSPLVVALRDAQGNAKPGVTVTFAAAQGGGRAWDSDVVTDASGRAQTVVTLGPTHGRNAITAT
jgi:hypothetical protein